MKTQYELFLSFRDIEWVLAIAENLSYSKAAKQVGIHQSTLSLRIMAIENLLKVKLFDRSTRQVKLTREGSVLIETFRMLIEIFDNDVLDTINVLAATEGESDELPKNGTVDRSQLSDQHPANDEQA